MVFFCLATSRNDIDKGEAAFLRALLLCFFDDEQFFHMTCFAKGVFVEDVVLTAVFKLFIEVFCSLRRSGCL